MTFLSFGKTRSGLPGRLVTFSRNLCPHERAILLTRSSGFVFLLRISAICLLRSIRVSVSIASYKVDGTPRQTCPKGFRQIPCGKTAQSDRIPKIHYSLFLLQVLKQYQYGPQKSIWCLSLHPRQMADRLLARTVLGTAPFRFKGAGFDFPLIVFGLRLRLLFAS